MGLVWVGDKFKPKTPNHGPCAVCDENVISWYPWWTANPDRKDLNPRPVHSECNFKER